MLQHEMGLEELTDLVNQHLTVNCLLPKILGDDAIQRIITQDASRYFYRWYKYATQKGYFYINLQEFYSKKSTGEKFIYLPDEIETVTWIYKVNFFEINSLGYIFPNSSTGGILPSVSPYVYSFTANIGEFAEFKASLDNFGDALAIYQKNTWKNFYNPNNKRLEILTQFNDNMVVEAYIKIAPEALYGDNLFQKYVIALSKIAMATVLKLYKQPIVGDVQIDTEFLLEMGKSERDEVIAAITKIGSSFFFVRTR